MIRNACRGLEIAFSRAQRSQSESFSAKPSKSGISDIELTRLSLLTPAPLEVGAFSMRGRGHRLSGEARQDAYVIFETENSVVMAVADGVSSSKRSEVAANIAVKNLESDYNDIVGSESLEGVDMWLELNRRISKRLLNKFAHSQKQHGLTVPTALHQLREAAADEFATTLEVLVISKQVSADSSREFLYVSICGDGGLFRLQQNSKDIVDMLPERLEIDQNGVLALPAVDELPTIQSGKLLTGESLILCTDGLAENMRRNLAFRQVILKMVKQGSIDYLRMVESATFAKDLNYDDKTAILALNK